MGTIGANVDTTVSKVEGQLELWGAKLKELVAKAEVAGKETKLDAHKHLDEVKAKLVAARNRLDEAKAAGSEKWTSFKSSVESSFKDLEEAFHKLAH